ncbi:MULTISPECIES: GGDEF domain-containing protein [Psychrilyobacter]|nr:MULTISPECIES: GGDEF domain-containing protein [Psychrilyobacter]MCS5422827.1 GGDEF domain-containing protein [Psychrilyobacter sp. S5]NDI77180.1 GGDEF domain-containing protein [Psychrilyobacter piezotolerans]
MEVKLKESLKIVVYYMFISFLWILFSDKILYMMVKDIEYYKLLQTYKGSFFILLTSVLLFKLIHSSYLKVETLDRQLQNTLTQLKSNKIELEKLAYVDYLTGLATRRLLDEKYELLFESAKRSETMLTLVMIDLDYFKKYNDRYGHLEGDRVLKAVGKLLKEVFKRNGDVISRYGGEEFMVILCQTPLKDTISLVENFQEKLKGCNVKHEDSPFGEITASLGINNCKISKNQDSENFLRKVDQALYKAKEGGRNRYSF